MNWTSHRLTRRGNTAVVAALLAAGLTATAGPLPAVAATTRVVTSGADSGPGTLRQVVADAAAGDTVTFAVGTVTLTTGQITIDKNLTIRGDGPAVTSVTRSASTPRFRIFEVPATSDVTIDLLTVTGGDEVFGGGIRSTGRLTVARSRVTGNRAAVGAGIESEGGELSVLNSAVSFNVVDTRGRSYGFGGGQGGGLTTLGGSTLIRNSEIVGNTVLSDGAGNGGSGGGIDSHGPMALIDSLVSSNTVTSFAGGVWMDEGTISGSVIRDNASGLAGGAYFNGSVSVERTEVSGNAATLRAGGIFASLGETTLTNVTLSGNTASEGAALYVGYRGVARVASSTVASNSSSFAALETQVDPLGGGRYRSGDITLQDTIVGPQAAGPNCYTDPNAAPIGDGGHNLTFGDASCGATVTNADPHLGPLAANGGTSRTMALGGPAGVDAGSGSCPATDQRGFGRVGACDVGAFEAGAQLPDTSAPTCVVLPSVGALRDVVVQDGGRGLQEIRNVTASNGWVTASTFLPGTTSEVRLAVVKDNPSLAMPWSFDVLDQVGNARTCTSATTTTLVSSPNPSALGQAVTFTATVTASLGVPAGTVSFTQGPVTLGVAPVNAGQATFTTSSLATGEHAITASYAGDGLFVASSASTTQTVVGSADVSVSVTDAPDPVPLGDTFRYTVTVANAGPSPATSASATLAMSGPSRTVLSATATQGTCSIGTAVSCSLGAIPANGTATIVVRVEPNAAGSIVATVTATAAEPDPNGPNQATAATTVDNGHGCTIIGTPGNDTITGTNKSDVICALGGDDIVSGGNGDDVIYAGSGNDRSYAETFLGVFLDNGSDTIYGGPGNDVLDGGNGNDTLVDTEGTDTLSGGNGNDTIVTVDGTGGDTANGGLGTDTCTTDANDTRESC